MIRLRLRTKLLLLSLLPALIPIGIAGQTLIGITREVGLFGVLFTVGLFPAVAALHPENWRICFAVMGIASFLTGLLMLMIREPARGASEPELRDVVANGSSDQFKFAWMEFWALFKIRSWRLLLVNELLTKVSIVVFTGWNFTWLNGLGLATPVFYGTILVVFVGMTIGSVLFGWLGDRLERRFPDLDVVPPGERRAERRGIDGDRSPRVPQLADLPGGDGAPAHDEAGQGGQVGEEGEVIHGLR